MTTITENCPTCGGRCEVATNKEGWKSFVRITSSEKTRPFDPDYVVQPGDTLRDFMEENRLFKNLLLGRDAASVRPFEVQPQQRRDRGSRVIFFRPTIISRTTSGSSPPQARARAVRGSRKKITLRIAQALEQPRRSHQDGSGTPGACR